MELYGRGGRGKGGVGGRGTVKEGQDRVRGFGGEGEEGEEAEQGGRVWVKGECVGHKEKGGGPYGVWGGPTKDWRGCGRWMVCAVLWGAAAGCCCAESGRTDSVHWPSGCGGGYHSGLGFGCIGGEEGVGGWGLGGARVKGKVRK